MFARRRLRLFGVAFLSIWLGSACDLDAAGERARRDPQFGFVVLAHELDGRHYYGLDPAATCRSNDIARTRLRTWRQHVEFKGDKLLVWGQVCNDQAEQLDLRKVRNRLRITADLQSVDFDRIRLRYETEPPKLCPAGTWCPAEEKQPLGEKPPVGEKP